ncbi:triple tyrosine motif-containing protein, partial [Candidatus Pelagibacter sp.]|nr:triple tyrosine motif-containing protein [Candidatus Pelagibacter sp.]
IDLKLTGRVYQIKESKIFKDYIYVRAKNGIFIVSKKYPNKYKILHNIKSTEHIKESISKNEIWFAVQKKGVYRTKLISNDFNQLNKSETKLYDDSYLPKKGKIKIFKIYDKLIFKTQDKIYQFNENKEIFYISKIFDAVTNIKEKVILKIEKTNNKTYWINFTERINDRRVQTFYELDESFDLKLLPFNSLAHHLSIRFFFLKDLTLMSSNEGIVVIGKLNKEPDSQKVIFSTIKSNDTHILNFGPEKDLLNNKFTTKNLFNYNENKLSFTVSLTDYINEKNNQFRYKLEGYENDYSKFSKNETITYTNLNPGDYKFYIQGISSEGLISDTNFFSFTISPPWWQSKIFYLSEILFFLILLSVTLFLKKSGKATIIATSISFMMILALFEYINFLVDPLILLYSNGVPVFTIFSKIILGVLLLPLERLMNKMLDYVSNSNFFRKLTSIKK